MVFACIGKTLPGDEITVYTQGMTGYLVLRPYSDGVMAVKLVSVDGPEVLLSCLEVAKTMTYAISVGVERVRPSLIPAFRKAGFQFRDDRNNILTWRRKEGTG
jgi:hypothetical protein